jgi:hypothetical protein
MSSTGRSTSSVSLYLACIVCAMTLSGVTASLRPDWHPMEPFRNKHVCACGAVVDGESYMATIEIFISSVLFLF